MSLLRKAHQGHAVPRPHHKASRKAAAASRSRICRFEQMESRQLLSVAAPIQIGAVYFEDSSPRDQGADVFEITYNGGAPGTQLTELRIDADKLGDGLTIGDTFFDTAPGGLGAYGSSPFNVVSQSGIDSVSADVADGGTMLVLKFKGFDPGEKLVFSIDVDEQGFLSPNAVAEGGEFEGSKLLATFAAPHYSDASGSDIFYDAYDSKLSGSGLNLPNDNYTPPSPYMPPGAEAGPVYTAGAIFPLQQQPLPITLSGTVFEDPNIDNHRQSGEPGIAGVSLTLLELVNGDYVATGKTATTDANGNYKFEGLLPSTYRVVETQPSAYLSVGATAGTVGDATRGVVTSVDVLSSINLDGGDDSVHNDFAEVKPSCISGYVYADANNNGVFDEGEAPIAGVTLTLLDAAGNPTGKTLVTDATGYYRFCPLMPGTYGVAEAQPAGYYDGLDTAGSSGGTAHNPGDLIDAIPLASGVPSKNNNFGELLPASIAGRVFADLNNNETLDTGEPLLAGVTMYLLDGSGTRVASTATDAEGKYSFTDLKPGVYGVEEIQPTQYLEGGDRVGSVGGKLDGVDRIINVTLGAGVNGVSYDFWELLPAKISGYVFQDGPAIVLQKDDPLPNIPDVRDGKLTSDDLRLKGVTLKLCDASGYPLSDSHGNPITTVTDENGYYEFTGLTPGIYSVVQVQPDNYIPGVDTAGSKGGLVVNKYSSVDPSILSTLAVDPAGSSIVKIAVGSNDAAVQYNFSEVLIQRQSTPPKDPPNPPPLPPAYPSPPPPAPMQMPGVDYRPMGLGYVFPMQILVPMMSGGSGGPTGYTWHLSVIDAGQPRHEAAGEFSTHPQSSLFDAESWTGADLNQGQWILADKDGAPMKRYRFGLHGATPVVGDWDGTGCTKIGVFIEGLWFLDINGNGTWDENDLWAKLGHKGDQPVEGDWDGDGKTDIGIFGPAWIGDTRAIDAEPGMPDAANPSSGRAKNIPPNPANAAIGYRTMKRSQPGKMRSDLIDHVFEYGTKGDIAVTGDWNGDGIYAIGIFRNGAWFLDMDGDGRWSDADVMIEFGQQGDLPVVGDWTGDGISKVGVYRNGTFYLDTNNNRQLDATDKVFELGGPGDRPVAGDWNGEGIDKVGVYHDEAAAVSAATQPQAAE